MSNSRKIIGAFMLALCIAIAAPSTIPSLSNVTTVEAAKVKISKKNATIIKGQSLKLEVKNTSKKVKWSTSNKKIATVTSTGKVKAKKAGTVIITAKVGKKTYTCKLTVEQPKLSSSKLTIEKGKSESLKLNGTKQKVKWSTSNKKIATVNSKGKVTAKKPGTVKIIAKIGTKKYTCKVTVKKASTSKKPDTKGTPSNPISAYDVTTMDLFSLGSKDGKIQLQLKECITGTAAEDLLRRYYREHTDVPDGYQWVYMSFNARQIGGKRALTAPQLFWYTNFYNSTCNKQNSNYEFGIVSDSSQTCIIDFKLYPSDSGDFYIMFTAPINDFPLTYRVNTGYDKKHSKAIYTWFTTKQ